LPPAPRPGHANAPSAPWAGHGNAAEAISFGSLSPRKGAFMRMTSKGESQGLLDGCSQAVRLAKHSRRLFQAQSQESRWNGTDGGPQTPPMAGQECPIIRGSARSRVGQPSDLTCQQNAARPLQHDLDELRRARCCWLIVEKTVAPDPRLRAKQFLKPKVWSLKSLPSCARLRR